MVAENDTTRTMSTEVRNIWDGTIYVYNGGKVSSQDRQNITHVLVLSTVVADQAFAGCPRLTVVELSPTTQVIGNHTFSQCSNLTTILNLCDETSEVSSSSSSSRTSHSLTSSKGKASSESSSNVTTSHVTNHKCSIRVIGMRAFFRCESLTGPIVFPPTLETIEPSAFTLCVSLKSIAFLPAIIDDNSEGNNSDKIRNHRSSTNIVTSFKLSRLGSNAFLNCKRLESVIMPDSVDHCALKKLPNQAFCGLKNLKTIELPNVTSNSNNITNEDKNENGNSLEHFGKGVFRFCSSLKSVVIPTSVTQIEAITFKSCTSLMEIVLPPLLKTIEKSTFQNCSSLERVKLPDSVQVIDEYAFYGCENLRIIDFSPTPFNDNNTVEDVEEHKGSFFFVGTAPPPNGAATYNKDLVRIRLPDTIHRIGCHAFGDCTILEKTCIANSVGLHFFCDINRSGRIFLHRDRNKTSSSSSLWPLIIDRIIHKMIFPNDPLSGEYHCFNEDLEKDGYTLHASIRQASVIFHLLVHDGFLWEHRE